MNTRPDIIGIVKELLPVLDNLSRYPQMTKGHLARRTKSIAQALLIAVEGLEKGAAHEATWVVECEAQKPCTQALSRIRSL